MHSDPLTAERALQDGEAEEIADVIQSVFGPNYVGRFLNIGAFSGVDQLDSCLTNGWVGAFCEPDPYVIPELVETLNKYNNVNHVIVNCAVHNSSGLVPFYISDRRGTSSLCQEWSDNFGPQFPTVSKIITNTVSCTDLFNYIGFDFDVISVDAEGSDYAILCDLPLARLTRCKIIIIEMLCDESNRHLTNFGFTHVKTTGYSKNLVFVKH